MELLTLNNALFTALLAVVAFFLKREIDKGASLQNEIEFYKSEIAQMKNDIKSLRSTVDHNKDMLEVSFNKDVESISKLFSKDIEKLQDGIKSVQSTMEEIKSTFNNNLEAIYRKLDERTSR